MPKLNIGCGRNLKEDYINLDILDLHSENPKYIRHDLMECLPFYDSSIDGIICYHVLEHFLPEIVCEILWDFYRVLKEKAVLEIKVPNFKWYVKNFKRYEGNPIFANDVMYAILCHTRTRQMPIPHKSLWWYSLMKMALERVGFLIMNEDDNKQELTVISIKEKGNHNIPLKIGEKYGSI